MPEITKEEMLFEVREGVKEAVLDAFYVCPEAFDLILKDEDGSRDKCQERGCRNLEKQHNWIDTDEKFPDHERPVLIWDGEYDEDGNVFYLVASYIQDREYFMCVVSDCMFKGIRYWMELPRPPEDG